MNDTATIGHNSASIGEMLAENPALIFSEHGMDQQLFDEIKAEIGTFEPDLSTDKGRKEIASLAFGIAKRKTAIDAAGKALNEDHRKAINAVDSVRKRVRDTLDALKDEARKPLTEWEQKEEFRKSEVIRIREALAVRPAFGASSADIQAMIETVNAVDVNPDILLDQTNSVADEKDNAIEQLNAAHRAAVEAEQQREALENMRREQEAKEAAEREEAAKAEAARLEKERMEAAEKAAAERAAAEERRKAQEAIDAANREREAAEMKLREEANRKAEEERAQRQREADQAHRSTIMKAAKEAIMEHGDVDEETAKKIVLAITSQSIPNVSLRF